MIPNLPRWFSLRLHFLEVEKLPHGIHTGPKPIVVMSHQLPLFNQSIERLLNQLIALESRGRGEPERLGRHIERLERQIRQMNRAMRGAWR